LHLETNVFFLKNLLPKWGEYYTRKRIIFNKTRYSDHFELKIIPLVF